VPKSHLKTHAIILISNASMEFGDLASILLFFYEGIYNKLLCRAIEAAMFDNFQKTLQNVHVRVHVQSSMSGLLTTSLCIFQLYFLIMLYNIS
jgi:hypothetical protein